jgi:hypothetical protein
MPRMYTVPIDNGSIAAASGDYDLWELDAATDKPIELVGVKIAVTSEIQEAQEEWIRIAIVRGNTTTGNGSTATPAPVSAIDTAAGFTAKIIGSTPASAGTAVNLDMIPIQVRAGDQILYPDGCSFWTSGATLMSVRLLAAVTDDLTLSGNIWVREYP